jgi:hypothetical protein
MSSDISDSVLFICKDHVGRGELVELQDTLAEAMSEKDYYVDWPVVFQKLYLHACLKGWVEIAEWMEHHFFKQLDPLHQIALRQTFAYGHTMLRRRSSSESLGGKR